MTKDETHERVRAGLAFANDTRRFNDKLLTLSEGNSASEVKTGAIRQALILVTLAFLPALGEAVYFRNKVSWQSRLSASEVVSVDQARTWGDNVMWVDARPAEEFENDHIPNAILLNEDDWNELLPQFLAQWSPEKRVVVYCSAQSCNAAAEVARRLREEAQLKDNEGKNCVFVLEGGWEEWLKTR